jgi:NADPH:quinone reductase-like Zn-dependent oxidoreductase
VRNQRVVVTRYGGPDVITVVEEEIPTPKAGEARVKVLAAGVSLPDVLAREGVHPETPRVPYTPGWDFVGTVDQLGEGVTGIALGQTVAAMPIHGCYAQYVCVPVRKLIRVPRVARVPRCCSWRSWPELRCTERAGRRVRLVRELGGIAIDYRDADFVFLSG